VSRNTLAGGETSKRFLNSKSKSKYRAKEHRIGISFRCQYPLQTTKADLEEPVDEAEGTGTGTSVAPSGSYPVHPSPVGPYNRCVSTDGPPAKPVLICHPYCVQ